MIEFWKSLTYTTKFSTIAFLATGVLGFISMGLLGALLYYPVSIFLKAYPHIDDCYGDWMWPATIMVGIVWSFGFVFAGIAWSILDEYITSTILLRIIYIVILWLWAALLWYFIFKNNVAPK